MASMSQRECNGRTASGSYKSCRRRVWSASDGIVLGKFCRVMVMGWHELEDEFNKLSEGGHGWVWSGQTGERRLPLASLAARSKRGRPGVTDHCCAKHSYRNVPRKRGVKRISAGDCICDQF